MNEHTSLYGTAYDEGLEMIYIDMFKKKKYRVKISAIPNKLNELHWKVYKYQSGYRYPVESSDFTLPVDVILKRIE